MWGGELGGDGVGVAQPGFGGEAEHRGQVRGSAPVARATSRMRSWRSWVAVAGRPWNNLQSHNPQTGAWS